MARCTHRARHAYTVTQQTYTQPDTCTHAHACTHTHTLDTHRARHTYSHTARDTYTQLDTHVHHTQQPFIAHIIFSLRSLTTKHVVLTICNEINTCTKLQESLATKKATQSVHLCGQQNLKIYKLGDFSLYFIVTTHLLNKYKIYVPTHL